MSCPIVSHFRSQIIECLRFSSRFLLNSSWLLSQSQVSLPLSSSRATFIHSEISPVFVQAHFPQKHINSSSLALFLFHSVLSLFLLLHVSLILLFTSAGTAVSGM